MKLGHSRVRSIKKEEKKEKKEKKQKIHQNQDFTQKEKIKKKVSLKNVPRVIFALEIKDNYVHLIKDTKPLIAFYYDKNCSICQSLNNFFLTLVCEKHFIELQNNNTNNNNHPTFQSCSHDLLFPLQISPLESQTPTIDIEYEKEQKEKKDMNEEDEDEDNCTKKDNPLLPLHHKILYRMRDGEKHFYESILLHANYKSERGYINKIKNSLHLSPSQNKWKPQRHQQDASIWYNQGAFKEKSLLIHWGLGSGKTSGILYMIESNLHLLPEKVRTIYIVCPNTIIEYWHNTIVELKSFQSNKVIAQPLNYIIVGYTQFEKMCNNIYNESLQFISNDDFEGHFLFNSVVIMDECHYLRNISNVMKPTLFGLQFSYQTIGSTGTLFINDIHDILGMILLMKGPKIKTKSKQDQTRDISWYSIEHMDEEIENWKVELFEKKNYQSLSKIFSDRTHYFDPQIHDVTNLEKNYPLLQRYYHRVPMSLVQMFDYLLHQKRDLTFGNITYSSAVRNAYNTVLKSLSNTSTYEGINAIKFQEIVVSIKKINQFPQVIFSRFREKGVSGFQQLLKKVFQNLEIELICGNTPTQQRQKIIDSYNCGKKHLLLLCDVGGEGIDLKNTVALHLMETFENLQSEQQTIYRVCRYNSHDQKQKQQQQDQQGQRPIVQIHTYVSFFPDLVHFSFPNEDIMKVENLFIQKFGKEIHLVKTPLEKENKNPNFTGPIHSFLTWSKQPDTKWYIADILYQLQHQKPKQPLQAIEETMLLNNIEKQKRIDPLFQSFVKFTRQIF